ncbi:MAG: orotidine-5'-phosphate decarboxylase [Actinobacteria bacterium]|nr:orotidine-5'-phosphate decarboxylase [Actinomycetota bacterium]
MSGSRSRAARCPASRPAPPSRPKSRAELIGFADRLTALVEERRSQVCLGLDPDPARLLPGIAVEADGDASPAVLAGRAVAAHCRELIARVGPHCVAVKPQLACFERLGPAGWEALEAAREASRQAGLIFLADGKRGDVPVTAAAYGQALVGSTPTPWGEVPGLGADAFTANPLLGRDALEPLLDACAAAGAGIFVLVRTSNPGAADLMDVAGPAGSLHERIAALVDELSGRLLGDCGLSGVGAVVGATEPEHIARLRELMPRTVFLLPGVGAQGGDPGLLGAAFAPGPAAAIVPSSRGIAGAPDPAAAARELRETLWDISNA